MSANPLRDYSRNPRSTGKTDGDLELTDTGNAKRLISRAGTRIRWVAEAKTWMCCNESKLWERDTTHEVVRLTQDAARALLMEAAVATPEAAKDLAKHAIRSQSRQKLFDAIELAKAEPGTTISTGELDADAWILSVQNGIVALRTGTLRDRLPSDLITKCAAARFDPNADCPRFLEFLNEVMRDDSEMVAFLQRLVGYMLLGGNPEQVLAILVGSGANGKSTLLQVLSDLLDTYAQTTPAETFMARRDGAATNDLARLRGSRMVSATEAEQGRRLAENLVKRLTGNDRIAARFLFAEYFEFVPQFLAFLAVNHKPIVSGDDPAIWRRLLVIPFAYVVPAEKRDPRLAEKLLEERDGILAWAVAGCLQWQRVGLSVQGGRERVPTADGHHRNLDGGTDGGGRRGIGACQ
jgi:putative DNA primase/helicase